MAVAFSRASQAYTPLVDAKTGDPDDNTPRVFNFTFNVPDKVRMMQVSFTREGLPAGNCIGVYVTAPDGSMTGGVITGGPSRSALARCGFGTLDGNADDVPAGTYGLQVKVFQGLATAVTAEVFT